MIETGVRAEANFDRYHGTVLVFPEHGGLRVPVCAELTATARAQLEALRLGETFAVVTPCNPMGQTLAAAENARRVELMQQELTSAGIRHMRADGWSLDGSHVEQGFACAVDGVGAAALARRWQQAWWWWNGDQFELRATA